MSPHATLSPQPSALSPQPSAVRRNCAQRRQHGFTLVELSIVLVIIGLLLSGILIGQQLIGAAKLRKVVTDASRIEAATLIFQDKYGALPGDMANATKFWGYAWPCSSGLQNGPVMQGCTRDGNGDGFIKPFSGASPYNYLEPGGFWDHLAKAGLIEGGSYNGFSQGWWPNTASGGHPSASLGSSYAGAFWSILYYETGSASFSYPTIENGHYLWLSGWGCGAYNKVLSVEEMLSVDTKFDDGKPDTGRIMTPNDNHSQGGWGCYDVSYNTCMTQNASGPYGYNTAAAGPLCSPIFKMSF